MLSNAAFQITLKELKNEYRRAKRILKERYKGAIVHPNYTLSLYDGRMAMRIRYHIAAGQREQVYNIALWTLI